MNTTFPRLANVMRIDSIAHGDMFVARRFLTSSEAVIDSILRQSIVILTATATATERAATTTVGLQKASEE
jgi:hypothetical protein